MEHDFIIENEILQLRPLSIQDIEKLRQWRNHPEIRKWFITQITISKDQQLQWYTNYLKKENDYVFVIVEKNSKKDIGTVSLYDIDLAKGQARAGRLIIGEEQAKGKKYGLMAYRLLINFGFNTLNLKMFHEEVLETNEASINMLIRCGFKLMEHYKEKGVPVIKIVLPREMFRKIDSIIE